MNFKLGRVARNSGSGPVSSLFDKSLRTRNLRYLIPSQEFKLSSTNIQKIIHPGMSSVDSWVPFTHEAQETLFEIYTLDSLV